MADKLEPCPFCGEQESLDIWGEDYDVGRYWYVVCRECGAEGEREPLREAAVRFWNTRAPHPDTERLEWLARHNVSMQLNQHENGKLAAQYVNAGHGDNGADSYREWIDKLREEVGDARVVEEGSEHPLIRAYRTLINREADIEDSSQAELEAIRAERDQLKAGLREVVSWIANWSPSFTDDDEWHETEARVAALLEEDNQ